MPYQLNVINASDDINVLTAAELKILDGVLIKRICLIKIRN